MVKRYPPLFIGVRGRVFLSSWRLEIEHRATRNIPSRLTRKGYPPEGHPHPLSTALSSSASR
jgi:hypothetical protein